jgi:hypothetical protein
MFFPNVTYRVPETVFGVRHGIAHSVSLHTSPKNSRVVKSAFPSMTMPDTPFFEFLFSKLDKYENKTALVSKQKISFF